VMDDRSFQDFEKQNSSFEHVSAISGGATSLTGFGETDSSPRAVSHHGVLASFGVGASLGPALFQKQDNPAGVAVLSDKLWRAHFGSDRSILGKVVKLDGAPPYHPWRDAAGFASPPMRTLAPAGGKTPAWTSWAYSVIGRLKNGVSIGQARAEAKAFAQRRQPKEPHAADNAGAISLQESLVGKIRPSLYVLLGACGIHPADRMRKRRESSADSRRGGGGRKSRSGHRLEPAVSG